MSVRRTGAHLDLLEMLRDYHLLEEAGIPESQKPPGFELPLCDSLYSHYQLMYKLAVQ